MTASGRWEFPGTVTKTVKKQLLTPDKTHLFINMSCIWWFIRNDPQALPNYLDPRRARACRTGLGGNPRGTQMVENTDAVQMLVYLVFNAKNPDTQTGLFMTHWPEGAPQMDSIAKLGSK